MMSLLSIICSLSPREGLLAGIYYLTAVALINGAMEQNNDYSLIKQDISGRYIFRVTFVSDIDVYLLLGTCQMYINAQDVFF